MRVGLISCCKEKLTKIAPAKELYCSQLFKLAMVFVQRRCDQWAILSAKYGLVCPNTLISPYDESLNNMVEDNLNQWSMQVEEEIREIWNPNTTIFLVVSGGRYRRALRNFPMVEDAISIWTNQRRSRDMQKPQMGIGVIKKALKEGWGF